MKAPDLGTAQVIRADSRRLPLADNSVDLVVTSPPYFALRSYQDGGGHYEGQIGDEPTPAEFVAALLEVTRECVRVLKPSGSLWVNLGDKYSATSSPGPQSQKSTMTGGRHKGVDHVLPRRLSPGAPPKSLIGIPWRYALACIDDLGLILRAEVIWSKPNGLPESVTDRVRRSHEQWFHFTLEPRYFSAVDEIREPHVATTTGRDTSTWRTGPSGQNRGTDVGRRHDDGGRVADFATSPLGKLPGSVWTVPTEPLRVPDHLGIDHFAAFPTEWPKRIIQGWSPAGVCVECGEGRRPVADVSRIVDRDRKAESTYDSSPLGTMNGYRGEVSRTITGYACGCVGAIRDDLQIVEGFPARSAPPTTPAVVLDPFGGTGTTAMVAKALGRHGISVDMSADYCRLAEWRTNDRNQLAKVLGVAKTDAPDPDQLGLFDGDDAA